MGVRGKGYFPDFDDEPWNGVSLKVPHLTTFFSPECPAAHCKDHDSRDVGGETAFSNNKGPSQFQSGEKRLKGVHQEVNVKANELPVHDAEGSMVSGACVERLTDKSTQSHVRTLTCDQLSSMFVV